MVIKRNLTKTTETQQTSSTPKSVSTTQGQNVQAVELNSVIHDVEDKNKTEEIALLNERVVTERNERIEGDNTISSEVISIRSQIEQLRAVIDSATQALQSLEAQVTNIDKLIPLQASEDNQLADKDFVNSSVATNTSNFIGTFNTLEELEQQTATNNDYAFWKTTDEDGNVLFKRYKFVADDNTWQFEYDLNNSSFTAEQWATINSGLTEHSLDDYAKTSQIPTKVSQLTNDSNYASVNQVLLKSGGEMTGYVSKPSDGFYGLRGSYLSTTSQEKGWIIINLGKMPQVDMFSLKVSVEEYDAPNTLTEFHFKGYVYTDNKFYNCTGYGVSSSVEYATSYAIFGTNSDGEHIIAFSKAYSSERLWSYPQIRVYDVTSGYSHYDKEINVKSISINSNADISLINHQFYISMNSDITTSLYSDRVIGSINGHLVYRKVVLNSASYNVTSADILIYSMGTNQYLMNVGGYIDYKLSDNVTNRQYPLNSKTSPSEIFVQYNKLYLESSSAVTGKTVKIFAYIDYLQL